MRKIAVLLTLLLFCASSLQAGTLYRIDPAHSQINFIVPYLMFFKVRGHFNDFSGDIQVDVPGRTLTSATASISVASIDTREEDRDKHLRSADFFHVEEHPTIDFVTRQVQGSGSNIEVVGDLTIRGVTREITLKGSFVGVTTDPWGNERVGFAATGAVDRRDFGVVWNRAVEGGGVLVGDQVTIELEISAVRE